MSMPGFTAHVSLYKTTQYYGMTGAFNQVYGTISPAQVVLRPPRQRCPGGNFDNCFFITAAKNMCRTDPMPEHCFFGVGEACGFLCPPGGGGGGGGVDAD